MTSSVLTIRVPQALLRRFRAECRRQGRTMSEVVRDFIAAYATVDEMEVSGDGDEQA